MADQDRDRLAAIPLFSALARRELRAVRQLVTPVQIRRRERVIRRGSVGREFMIIDGGAAAVLREDEEIAHLGNGDFFGEVALLSGRTRNADVVIEPGTELLVMSQHEFHQLLRDIPSLSTPMFCTALARTA